MRVKELRQKLADFGEKNRHHFESSQKLASQSSDTTNGKIKDHAAKELDDLEINTKPSTTSTSPSSTYEDEFSPPSSVSTKILLGPFLNKQAVNQSYSFDSSSDDGSKGSDSTLPPPPQYSSSSELEYIMGKEHIDLLEKQAPTVINSKGLVVEDTPEDEDHTFGCSPTGSMHNSTLLQGALLTKSTLDTLCQVEVIHEETSIPNCTSSKAASIHSSGVSMSDDIDSVTSLQSNDSDSPSIVPGALSPRMANMFLNTSEVIQEEEPASIHEPVLVLRRKKIQPKDLPFLKNSLVPKNYKEPAVITRRKQITPEDLPFLKAPLQRSDPNKVSDEINPKPRNTSVGQGIRKFGGRKSRIEQRKDELSKKWAQSNSVAFVKKETWEFCKATGGYKKKFYIEKEVKDET
ncbi:hypothetical protein IV203_013105 [Nitzschia inconspicua]|uniref:Uncharacterized protein n=1 Tax=Nitzschia inconspicua TaxID=303405 RepID=A0A9K3M6B8_9STRA|nr:hypothetical protein IV203_013105 [Nitzschia inconspicua]